jgi:hypothetical protein
MSILRKLFGRREKTVPSSPPKAERWVGDGVASDDGVMPHNCVTCMKGKCTFMMHDGRLTHLDLFATAEAGAMYKCGNSETIRKFLTENENGGIYVANDASKDYFIDRQMWWSDVIELASELMPTEDLQEFFAGEDPLWKKPKREVEAALLSLVSETRKPGLGEDFPFLETLGQEGVQ